MPTYLLLRDNRQQGPFSLEELISKGLKPYDLVWAEGKSAAWRYPGEIPELSAYAPLVEEQPFDRFYKKQEEKNEGVPSDPILAESAKKQEPEPPKTVRRIYVHVPAGSNPPAGFSDERTANNTAGSDRILPSKAIQETTARLKAEQESRPIPSGHEKFLPEAGTKSVVQPVDANMQSRLNNAGNNSASVKNQSYSPQKSINELYPDRSDVYRKEIALPEDEIAAHHTSPLPPSVRRSAMQQLLQKPAFVAAMLLVVIAAALAAILLNNAENKPPAVVQQTPLVPPPVQQEDVPSDEAVQQQQMVVPTVEEKKEPQPSSTPIVTTQQKPAPDITSENKVHGTALPPVSGRNNGSATDNKDDYAKAEVSIDKKEKKTWKYEELPATTENGVRSKSARNETTPVATTEVTPQKPVVKTAAIALGDAAFTKGTLGGMYDIKIPVKNNSGNKIDLVIVEVQYIKANGEVLQTKKLSLDHLLPGEQYTLKAPDSNRGVKLNCTVSLVTAGNGISMVQQ